MNFFEGKKVLVTGGTGFIGSHVAEELVKLGSDVTVSAKKHTGKADASSRPVAKNVRVEELDIKNFEETKRVVKGNEIVINLASSIGNTEFNRSHADIFRENMTIELNMLEASRLCDVKRYFAIGSGFVYPDLERPLKEDDSLLGEPPELKYGYGWSKRANEVAAKCYFLQYGLPVAIARPSNVYGPRDNFFSGRGHVVPTFIEKIFSGEKTISVAGSGEQIRNFIYVKDCVQGILSCVEKHAKADPINLATKEQTTIKELAQKIIAISGKRVSVKEDMKMPTGPKIIMPDCAKAKKLLGFEAKTTLDEGLALTIDWFKNSHKK